MGTRHSFSELISTTSISISLSQYQGIVSVDHDKRQATIKSGTTLRQLSAKLLKLGLMMENLGDIDAQTLGGSIITGTHGTGIAFGNLATQVVSLSLITAGGERLFCSNSQNKEIFRAALVSLGSLGFISEVTLQLVPAYKLKFVQSIEGFKDCLLRLDQRLIENRNFEYFFFPYTKITQAKSLNITDEAAEFFSISHYLNDLFLENGVLKILCEICRLFPKSSRLINQICAWGLSNFTKVNWGTKIYSSPRNVKFNEMEYSIPRVNFKDAIEEIVEEIERKKFDVCFPIECRFVKADDIWLSPAYGRESAFIAVHMYKGMEHRSYFSALEAILRNHQGRPHWGKMHTQTANELSKQYPMWDRFQKLRLELDPNGLFMSPYLSSILSLKTTPAKELETLARSA
jgi:FAD-linked oxidoreductase